MFEARDGHCLGGGFSSADSGLSECGPSHSEAELDHVGGNIRQVHSSQLVLLQSRAGPFWSPNPQARLLVSG